MARMSVHFAVFILLFTASTRAFPQAQIQEKYAAQINVESLKENLQILASDALEGRETGKRGQKMAAAFIKSQFQEYGLRPANGNDFYQPFPLYRNIPANVYLKAGGHTYFAPDDIISSTLHDSGGEKETTLIFGGNGESKEPFPDVNEKAIAYLLPTETRSLYAYYSILEKGASALFLIASSPQQFEKFKEQFRQQLFDTELQLTTPATEPSAQGMFILAPHVGEALFGKSLSDLNKSKRPQDVKASVNYHAKVMVQTVMSENVLGYVEGTDKKEEVVIITAHYDHIGISPGSISDGDRINNGADDDGSGTSAVLALANVFANAARQGHPPRRTVVFMTVSAEEIGLYGSQYYVEHPIFPLQQTVVNLNIDMIGRRDAKHAQSPPYIYVIGSDKLSMELHEVNERSNSTYTKLIFDYTYNDTRHPERLYYRSDHWNFAKNNIPIIFYFDGLHADYHMPSDEVDKIEFDLLAIRTRCIFHTAWELANREERIKLKR